MRSTVPSRIGLAESRDEATEDTDNVLGRRCAFGTSLFVLTSSCDVRRVVVRGYTFNDAPGKSNEEDDHGNSRWTSHCVDSQRRSQFSGYHRGLTVLCDGQPENGPEPSEEDQQVARRLVRCVTELVNRPDCHSGFDGFDPHTHRQLCSCSSAEECLATNQGVGSSNLSGSSNEELMRGSSVVEHLAHNQAVASSILAPATNQVALPGESYQGIGRNLSLTGGELCAGPQREEPGPGRACRRVAQLEERSLDKADVVGSTPTTPTMCADSSTGRAPVLQTGCRRFDPYSAHQTACSSAGRTRAFQARCPRFEPEYAVQHERTRSTMVVLSAHNRLIEGSIPSGSTTRSVISPAEWVGDATVALTVAQGCLNIGG